MIVTVYTRHSIACRKKHNYPTSYRRCKCPKWLYSASWTDRPQRSAKTRSWDEAETRARAMEQGSLTPAPSSARTVEASVKAYLTDIEGRNLSLNYKAKLRRELNALAEWSKAKPVPTIKHMTMELLEEFRHTWKEGPVTRRKRQERMRSFFLYCVNHGWIILNPAKALSRIKVDQTPTDYFTRDEMKKILAAVETFHEDAIVRQKMRAMVLLMRWSGLRVGDAAMLARERIAKGKLLLYTQKTGTPVYVPLPANVVQELEALPNGNKKYFFWSGNGTHAANDYWGWFAELFEHAKLGKKTRPHMLRDTFAVELLLAGVPLDQVSILLGHTSVKITEKHYSPFVKARQQQLEQSVRKAWQ